MTLDDSCISEVLEKYRFNPDAVACERIRRYISILLRWNQRISLTSVVDPLEVLRFHFGESIYAHSIGLLGSGRLADVGSGAGFPGMAIGLIERETRVTLIEPNLKKSVFLVEVSRELGLRNIEVIRGRMDAITVGEFDFVTSRALGRASEFLNFARAHLTDRGKAVLWVGKADAEDLISEQSRWKWSAPISIPASERRCILAGSPTAISN